LLRRDGEIIDDLADRHCPIQEPLILDPTWGAGGIWRGSRHYPQVRLDIEPKPKATHCASWLDLPSLFAAGTFQLAVVDVIFVDDVGGTSRRYQRYVSPRQGETGASVAERIGPLLAVVRAVLDPKVGTVLWKFQDINHANAVLYLTHELRLAALERGWRVCDYEPALARSLTEDPKWINQHLSPRTLTYWYVLHPGPRCPGNGTPRPRNHRCVVCGTPFLGRADALTCGPRCRRRLSRQQRREIEL
jgi:hypothetical protein